MRKPNRIRYTGFSVAGHGRLSQLKIDIFISPHFEEPVGVDDAAAHAGKASVSLAVDRTQIDIAFANVIGVTSEDTADLYLPGNICLQDTRIEIVELPIGIDCLLGMAAIGSGEISLSFANQKTVFSYRTPPQGGLDFVQPPKQQSTRSKVGKAMSARHQRCPCGSGKKHGNCCAQRR